MDLAERCDVTRIVTLKGDQNQRVNDKGWGGRSRLAEQRQKKLGRRLSICAMAGTTSADVDSERKHLHKALRGQRTVHGTTEKK